MEAEPLTATTGQPLQGPMRLHPRVFEDERGFFFESWNKHQWQRLLTDHGQKPVELVQDNHSTSTHALLRGLHYQLPPHAQGKLVRCVVGEVFDAISDAGAASWYDLAMAIGELGVDTGLLRSAAVVRPITTAQFPTRARRPSYSLLDCTSSRKALKLEPLHWRAALADVLTSIPRRVDS